MLATFRQGLCQVHAHVLSTPASFARAWLRGAWRYRCVSTAACQCLNMALSSSEVHDLLEGTGEWINTPDVIRGSIRDLHVALAEERALRQELQEEMKVTDSAVLVEVTSAALAHLHAQAMRKRLDACAGAPSVEALRRAVTERDEAIHTLSGDMAALTAAMDALKRLVDSKASSEALQASADAGASRAELGALARQVAEVGSTLQGVKGEVGAVAARVTAVTQHVDDSAAGTSQALKRSHERVQADLHSMAQGLARDGAARAGEVADLAGRVGDMEAALASKAATAELRELAASFVTEAALEARLGSFTTAATFRQRHDALELSLTALQAKLNGATDTLAGLASQRLDAAEVASAAAAQVTERLEEQLADLPCAADLEAVRSDLGRCERELHAALQGKVDRSALDRMREHLVSQPEFEAAVEGLASRKDVQGLYACLGAPGSWAEQAEGQAGRGGTASSLAKLVAAAQAAPPLHTRLDAVAAELRDVRRSVAEAATDAAVVRPPPPLPAKPAPPPHEALDALAHAKRALDGVDVLRQSTQHLASRLDAVSARTETAVRAAEEARSDAGAVRDTPQPPPAATEADLASVRSQLDSLRQRISAVERQIVAAAPRTGAARSHLSPPITPHARDYAAPASEERPRLSSLLDWGRPARQSTQTSSHMSLAALRTAIGLPPEAQSSSQSRQSSSSGGRHSHVGGRAVEGVSRRGGGPR